MFKNDYIFYDKDCYVYKIRAFEARLDKSNVRFKPNVDDYDKRKYFPNDNQTPLICTLMDQEAQEYGYKLNKPSIINKTSQILHHKQILSKSLVIKRRKAKIVTERSSLREYLDKIVLKATPNAMNIACKQYLSHPSRQVLMKYAHLFGLNYNELN